MTIRYSLVKSDDFSSLTVLVDGQVRAVGPDHPNWSKLLDLVTNGEPVGNENKVLGLLDPGVAVEEYFTRLSERVTLKGGTVFLDGEPIDGALVSHIVRYVSDDNKDAQPLVNFLEKVAVNPNDHSREQLYAWLDRHDFAINAEGNFLAYKGVRVRSSGNAVGGTDSDMQYPYESISTGTAVVDGKTYTGAIPNGVGAVVEMPRSQVQHDPSVGCHTGLHAGTWDYASDFSQGAVLLVEINPRDVVSVPTDCAWQKIRTCRYKVVEVINNELDSSYYGDESDALDDEDDDYCDCSDCIEY